MFDLLSIQEDVDAGAEGWALNYVFEKIWRVQILALHTHKHAEAASQYVVNQARTGDALAIRALRLVVHSQGGKK